uniref:Uncharacterized protein n=1 Tax=viral metagenome TaxID=1070528 RepID=A0A6C0CS19_9ZZZZ
MQCLRPLIDPRIYETDIMGTWGIGQAQIETDNIYEALNKAFSLKANVIVKPSRGKFYYIKGINNKKSYMQIELHVKNNEINEYKKNSRLWLINYI